MAYDHDRMANDEQGLSRSFWCTILVLSIRRKKIFHGSERKRVRVSLRIEQLGREEKKRKKGRKTFFVAASSSPFIFGPSVLGERERERVWLIQAREGGRERE